MRWLVCCCLLAVPLSLGQTKQAASDEDQQLQLAISEAGSSMVDLVRALEAHLARFPNSAKLPDIERALVKAAIELRDDRRIILYGERVLARGAPDAVMLERVSRALLGTGDPSVAERALKYSHQYQEAVENISKEGTPSGTDPARFREDVDRALSRALVLQSEAKAALGKNEEAVGLAESAYRAYASEESARQSALALAAAGRDQDAIRRYADAFTIPDTRATDTTRSADRRRMGELYRKVKGTEAGLGDLVLEAYDRTSQIIEERRLMLRGLSPNRDLTNPMEYILTALHGDKLKLASLIGKVVVMDFWATWCGPCRAQHPLYEQVKQRFHDRSDLVFLSIDTDEEHDAVEPFLKEQNWNQAVYFEGGLQALLKVNSIPTTIIVDKRGQVSSRMNGFLPDRFVDMLSERINDALKTADSH